MEATTLPPNNTGPSLPAIGLGPELLISLYVLIFILAVVGNILVIVTLIQNKRMRTVTNVLLLNLSLSDLILVIFCMPSTLLGTLLQNFIFGAFMCPTIWYLQGVSVGVSAFTLVAIALERYFAICQPLKSRTWQTLSHAYKLIVIVWILSASLSLPTLIYTKLYEINEGRHKCMERLPSRSAEIIYQLVLVSILLVIPFLLMVLAYAFISYTLWRGLRFVALSDGYGSANRMTNDSSDPNSEFETNNVNNASSGPTRKRHKRRENIVEMRRTQAQKSRQSKKRVIKMLAAVVLEFFICWSPSFIVTTWGMLDPSSQRHISAFTVTTLHLISYLSTCCNPITYAFMNVKFRQAFKQAFTCRKRLLINDTTMFMSHRHVKHVIRNSCVNGNGTNTRFNSTSEPDETV